MIFNWLLDILLLRVKNLVFDHGLCILISYYFNQLIEFIQVLKIYRD